jgi:hypothetical protein
LFGLQRNTSREHNHGVKSKPLICGLVLVSLVSVGIETISAQSPAPIAASPPDLHANDSPSVAVTYPDGSSLTARGSKGQFPLIAAVAAQTLNIELRFPPNAAKGLIVQPLDGGTSPQANGASTRLDGTASAQFQPNNQPGLYRVLLYQGGKISILQFWVPDPQRPDSGPPALKPSFGG